MVNILNLKTIKDYAPGRALERGRDYYERGLVRDLTEHNGSIIARVKGGHTYTVKMDIDVGDDFDYSCTCPMNDEGEFCKHCVAAALAWIDSKESKNKKIPPVLNFNDVENYLHTLDKSLLVEMLMEQAQENETLWKRLYLKTSQALSGGFNASTWRKMIHKAFDRTFANRAV